MKKLIFIISLLFFSWNVSAQNCQSENSNSTQNLVNIGKVWGFLKYHHPAVVAGKYDWDAELFSLMDCLSKNKDSLSVNMILERWIDSLGPVTVARQKPKYNKEDIKQLPDNAWIRDTSQLGTTLSAKLIAIESAKRPKSQYYLQDTLDNDIPIPTNEKIYNQVNIDENYRLLSLFRFWNIIQYFYPYKYAIDEQWDEILVKYIPQMISSRDRKEYILTLMKLCADVDDAHVIVPDQNWVFGKKSLPCILSIIEDKAIVTGYYDKTLGKDCGINVGDEVLEINGKPIKHLLIELLPYCSGGNLPSKLRTVCEKMVRTDSSFLSLKINTEGGIYTKSVLCYPTENMDMMARFHSKTEAIKIEDDIAYLYIGSLKRDELIKKIPEIKNTKGIILDLRSYPTDDVMISISDILLGNNKIRFMNQTILDFSRPGLFYFDKEKYDDYYAFSSIKNNKAYTGKLIILVNENTQSMTEYYTMMFSVIPGAVVLGSQTAATDGGAVTFKLPGDLEAMFTSVGIYYPDRSETERVGVKLTEDLLMTVDGIRTGVDPLINRGIELIKR